MDSLLEKLPQGNQSPKMQPSQITEDNSILPINRSENESKPPENENDGDVTQEENAFVLQKHEYTPSVASSDDENIGGHHGPDTDKKISSFTAVLTLMNTIIGGGIIALPNVMKNFGIVLGLIIYFFVYALTIFSCLLLLRAKNNCKKTDYGSIGIYCFKMPGKIMIELIIILNNFGISISYFIIFGTILHKLFHTAFEGNSFYYSKQFLILLIAIVILPFAFAKNIQKLRVVPYITISAICIYVFVTFYNFFHKVANDDLNTTYNFVPGSDFEYKSALGCFPTVFLAFTFQFNFFPVYKSLEDASDKKMMKISTIAITLVFFLYCFVGIAGYLSYGSAIQSNFLESFQVDDLGSGFYYLVLAAFCLSTSFTVPLFYFGCRNLVLTVIRDVRKILYKRRKQQRKIDFAQVVNEEKLIAEKSVPGYKKPISPFFFYSFSIFLYAIIVVLAIFISDIGPVFSLIGAICANGISFVLPAAFYMVLRKKKRRVYNLAVALFIFGICSGIVCLVGEVMKNF